MSDDELRNLRQTFLDHAHKARDDLYNSRIRFVAEYPGEPIPESLQEGFSLPEALAFMCEEIFKCKHSPKVALGRHDFPINYKSTTYQEGI